MTMKKCKDCGTEVSSKAEACPKCGRQRPGGGVSSSVVIVTAILGAAIIFWGLYRLQHFGAA